VPGSCLPSQEHARVCGAVSYQLSAVRAEGLF